MWWKYDLANMTGHRFKKTSIEKQTDLQSPQTQIYVLSDGLLNITIQDIIILHTSLK